MDNAYLAEFPDELPTHPTRGCGRTDISRNGYRPDVAFLCSLADRGGNGYSLGTCAYGICCIFNVGPLYDNAVRQQQ